MKLSSQRGQSLVEMAITAPILIFMLLGVFEVGWALRGYLVLTNVSREITRFSIRQGYLDYTLKNNNALTNTLGLTPAATTIGYSKVLSYVYTTLADQLPLDFSTGQTSTLIISHLVADTGLPCVLGANGKPNCNCNDFVTNPNFYLTGANVLTYDDLILQPVKRGYDNFYAQKYPPTSTAVTQLVYTQAAAQLARENNKFSCDLLKKSTGTIAGTNNVIVTELFYNQPQLFGFPVIANPYTDPVPMYAHTTMRLIVSSRTGENVDSVGPVCDAYPFAINTTTTPPFTTGNSVRILNGGIWLKWNPSAANNATYLSNELKYSRMVLNDFRDAVDGDTNISLTDRVAVLTGGPYTTVLTDVQALVQKEIRVPVGTGNPFVISRFARMRIESNTDINLGGGIVTATYLSDFTLDSGGYNICLPSD
jgi:hypothetical protein